MPPQAGAAPIPSKLGGKMAPTTHAAAARADYKSRHAPRRRAPASLPHGRAGHAGTCSPFPPRRRQSASPRAGLAPRSGPRCRPRPHSGASSSGNRARTGKPGRHPRPARTLLTLRLRRSAGKERARAVRAAFIGGRRGGNEAGHAPSSRPAEGRG